MTKRLIALIALSFIASSPSAAYTGPGLGLGALGTIIGIVGSLFVGLFAVIYYPLKRIFKKRAAKRAEKTSPEKASDE